MFNGHSLEGSLVGFALLLLLITGVRHYAQRSMFSPSVWLMLTGIVYGITHKMGLHALPAIEIDPKHVIMMALPILIFASSRLISPSDLKKDGLPIGLLAGPGVIATLFLIGWPISLMMDIPLIHGLLFAAPLAATDPVAVAGVLKQFKVPKRLGLILEGESLFNDGTAVVAFTAIAGLAFGTGIFSLPLTSGRLFWALIGAGIFGAIVGYATGFLLKKWNEEKAFSDITITLMLALGLFNAAEHYLHVSGVITVVVAALVFVRVRYESNATDKKSTRQNFENFWNYFDGLVTSILPFTLGSVVGMHDFPKEALWMVPIIIGLILIVRMIVVYSMGLGLFFMKKKINFSWQHIFVWGGVRGGISAALVQTIPIDYPYRNMFLCLAFAIILFTLIVNPILMRLFLKKGFE